MVPNLKTTRAHSMSLSAFYNFKALCDDDSAWTACYLNQSCWHIMNPSREQPPRIGLWYGRVEAAAKQQCPDTASHSVEVCYEPHRHIEISKVTGWPMPVFETGCSLLSFRVAVRQCHMQPVWLLRIHPVHSSTIEPSVAERPCNCECSLSLASSPLSQLALDMLGHCRLGLPVAAAICGQAQQCRHRKTQQQHVLLTASSITASSTSFPCWQMTTNAGTPGKVNAQHARCSLVGRQCPPAWHMRPGGRGPHSPHSPGWRPGWPRSPQSLQSCPGSSVRTGTAVRGRSPPAWQGPHAPGCSAATPHPPSPSWTPAHQGWRRLVGWAAASERCHAWRLGLRQGQRPGGCESAGVAGGDCWGQPGGRQRWRAQLRRWAQSVWTRRRQVQRSGCRIAAFARAQVRMAGINMARESGTDCLGRAHSAAGQLECDT